MATRRGTPKGRPARHARNLNPKLSAPRPSRDDLPPPPPGARVLTLKDLEDHGLEVAIIRSNTVSQMKSFLMQTFDLHDHKAEEEGALSEVAEAVDRVMSFGKPVELSPQSAHIRRLQHQLIEQHGLGSESRGEVPWRRVIVLPTRG